MSIGIDISAGAAVGAAVGVGIGVASVLGARIPASLRCLEMPSPGFVPFDFNPEKITFTRTSTQGNIPMPQRASATAPGSSNTSAGAHRPTKMVTSNIKLSNIIFEGPFTKLRCDTLLTWMNPKSGMLAMIPALRSNFTTAPATLTFQWGPPLVGFMYDVKITQCTVEYDRFSAIGIPLRATIGMTLQEIPSLLGSLPTNPTSGGLPGRRSHTVAAGESLQSIAKDNYGIPGLWRRIAEVNKIQDPARVRPGTQIYLPNQDELTASPR
jgi:nucleoid-associated protein YgaU